MRSSAGFLVVAGALAVWNYTTGAPPDDAAVPFILGVMGIVLELLAVPLPEIGFFSAGAAPFLALALYPGGTQALALVVPLAFFLRAVMRDELEPADRTLVAATDAVSLLGAAALMTTLFRLGERPRMLLLVALLGCLAWLGLQRLAARALADELEPEERLNWWPVFRRLQWHRLGIALTALPLLEAGSANPWLALSLGPIIWTTHVGAKHVIHRGYVERVDTVQEKLSESYHELDRTREKMVHTQQALQSTSDERKLLEEFSRSLGVNPDLEKAIQALLVLARKVGRADTIALFAEEEEGFFLTHCLGRPAEVERARLTGAREALAEEVHQKGQPLALTEKHHQGIFPNNRAGLALPVGRTAVLYLGRGVPEPFSDGERDLLALLASHAELGLESGRRYQSEKEALALYTAANENLSSWARRLTELTQWSIRISNTVESDLVWSELSKSAGAVIPHQSGAAVFSEPEGWRLARTWGQTGEEGPAWSNPATLALAQSTVENQRPIIIDDFKLSKFKAPYPGCKSLLAAPLLSPTRVWGVLMLATDRSFESQHFDLLGLLCSQGAVALDKARHIRDVVQAREQLEESQQQLVQSGKMAAVGQLAAGVAHELNSPLGAIQLAVSSARTQLQKNRPENIARKLDRAEKAADKARDIIEKMLVFSRKSDHRDELVEAKPVCHDTLDLIENQLKKQQIELLSDLSDCRAFLGNRNQVQQVLVNLLINARDAVAAKAQGAKRLQLFCREREGRVLLGVTDTGVGIAESDLERIFEPFYTTKEIGKGTGLGLALSHEIVTELGGEFEVSSTPGEGSTFIISFPVHP